MSRPPNLLVFPSPPAVLGKHQVKGILYSDALRNTIWLKRIQYIADLTINRYITMPITRFEIPIFGFSISNV